MHTPSEDIIKTVFGSILGNHLKDVSEKCHKHTDKIVEATCFLFKKILKDTKFSPTGLRFTY